MLFPRTRIRQSLFTIIIENIGFKDNKLPLLPSDTHGVKLDQGEFVAC